jgi:predicted nicotinamide N-methyase
LEEKDKTTLASFPYWIKIWESSIVLAAYLAEQTLDKNRTVLELGAGMGVVGLFLAAAGHPVTLTDCNPDALALLKKNAERNGLTSVTVRHLDWHRFESPGAFDIVCGAELVYRQADIQPAMTAVRKSIKPEGTVYLAHDIKRLSMIDFLAEAGKHFEIAHTGKSMTMGGEKKQVVIHIMTPKKPA